MARTIGRPLLPNENVHHRNGNRLDNRPENLELWVTSQPPGQRPEDLVAYAKELLRMYEPLIEPRTVTTTSIPATFAPGPPKLPRRPDTKIFRDLPISTWVDFSVNDVRDALASHVLGNFARSGQLTDACVGDDRVSSVLHTRVLGMLGLPFEIRPSESAHARRARKVARELESIWWDICPEAQIAELLRSAVMMGFALAEIVWTTRRGRWFPTLRTWHTQLSYYRIDLRRYVVFTQDGALEIEPGAGKWILFAPHGAYRGWMAGAIRAVAIPWLLRQYAHRDWARYSEVHGLPIRGCKVPATASEQDKENFYRQIAALGVETTVQLPQGLDGNGFGVELVEAAAGNWQAFENLISKCDVNIACQILGQNLTTEVQGGSFAAATAHGRVRQDYLEADAETVATDLHSQLVRPWAAFNYGDPALAPWPEWQSTPPEDRGQNATTLQAFATAVEKLLGLGVPIDVRELAEQYQIPLRKLETPLAVGPVDQYTYQYGIVTVNEARARMHLPPVGNGDVTPTPAAPPAATTPAASPSSHEEAESETVHLARRPRQTGHVDGQRYVDALRDHARSRAAAVVRDDVAAILGAVNKATSFEGLRGSLRQTYAKMKPAPLGEVTGKAITLAHLAGRTSLQQDL
ncbi:MAG TPA: DUF935 family protein [Polyangiaceae bacterium]|nr:DUF935 family protein [Polyangiaceae bacterium]